jgi:hypothetical protein
VKKEEQKQKNNNFFSPLTSLFLKKKLISIFQTTDNTLTLPSAPACSFSKQTPQIFSTRRFYFFPASSSSSCNCIIILGSRVKPSEERMES